MFDMGEAPTINDFWLAYWLIFLLIRPIQTINHEIWILINQKLYCRLYRISLDKCQENA
jgi:hypothetical protein